MPVQLKKGQRVRGYMLLADGQTADAGTAVWYFATDGPRTFHVKQELGVVWPSDDSPGSEATKQAERARFRNALERHRRIQAALRRCSDGGFVVKEVESFRSDGYLFQITPAVNAVQVEPVDLAAPYQQVLLLTVAHQLACLHSVGVVHADLKPENILLEQRGRQVVGRTIDFGASFQVGQTPPPEGLVGDPLYQAPEALAYQDGSGPAQLDERIDVFAAGLVCHRYVTGALPGVPAGYAWPGEALASGAEVWFGQPRHSEMRPLMPLIIQMLSADRSRRPPMSEVHRQMREWLSPIGPRLASAPAPKVTVVVTVPASSPGPVPSRLRIVGLNPEED